MNSDLFFLGRGFAVWFMSSSDNVWRNMFWWHTDRSGHELNCLSVYLEEMWVGCEFLDFLLNCRCSHAEILYFQNWCNMHNFNLFSVLFRVQVVCPDNQEFDPCQEWKFFSLPVFTAALIHLVSYPVGTLSSFCTSEVVKNCSWRLFYMSFLA